MRYEEDGGKPKMNSQKKPEDHDSDDMIASFKMPTTNLEILQLVHNLLRKLSPLVQVLMALIGLGIAGYFGNSLTNRLNNNQENVARALEARLVSTAYPHRGVTAFLLADLDSTLRLDSSYSPELKSALDLIDVALKDSAKNFTPEKAIASLTLTVNNIDHTLSSKSVSDSSPSWKKAVTNSDKEMETNFLMVPAISLRRVNPVYDPKTKTNRVTLAYESLNNENLKDVLKYNPEVVFDLQVPLAIEQHFKTLDQIPIQSLFPVQTYFISESGVIFLQASSGKAKPMSYSQKFPRYTLFMDRTYFWGAIDPKAEPKSENGPFDYKTGPYIDLGGNGLVKTYSKKVELPNNRVGVICVDVKLPTASAKEIEKRLSVLGANIDEFSWITSPGGLGARESNVHDGFEWVEAQLTAQSEEQSRLLGAVAFESDYDYALQKRDKIRFTVPVGSEPTPEGRTRTKLLLVTFDFNRIRRGILVDSFGFLLGIGLLVLVTWNALYDYNKLKREMNKVLENMSQVMYEAATPFAWLNEKNQFHKVNLSFLEAVGCKNDKELKQHAPTFRDLVTGETQPVYEEILSQSARGERTGRYEIDIIKKNGEVMHMLVHGERIPYPTFWRRGLPHRFGVFLPWPPKAKPDSIKQ
jgi:PAS domain-containing protein